MSVTLRSTLPPSPPPWLEGATCRPEPPPPHAPRTQRHAAGGCVEHGFCAGGSGTHHRSHLQISSLVGLTRSPTAAMSPLHSSGQVGMSPVTWPDPRQLPFLVRLRAHTPHRPAPLSPSARSPHAAPCCRRMCRAWFLCRWQRYPPPIPPADFLPCGADVVTRCSDVALHSSGQVAMSPGQAQGNFLPL